MQNIILPLPSILVIVCSPSSWQWLEWYERPCGLKQKKDQSGNIMVNPWTWDQRLTNITDITYTACDYVFYFLGFIEMKDLKTW